MISFDNFYPLSGNHSLGTLVQQTTLELSVLDEQLNQLQIDIAKEIKYNTNALQRETEENDCCLECEYIEKSNNLANEIFYRKNLSSPIDSILWRFQNLPLDPRCTIKVIQGNDPYIENFFKIQFTRLGGIDKSMDTLVMDLVKGMHGYSNVICPQMIKEAKRKIQANLKYELTSEKNVIPNPLLKVELYASFIKLDRVKTYDYLSVRKDAVLSDELINNASSLYVISECLLGGLFFGLQTIIEETDGSFRCTSMSVDSKGCISKIALNLETSYHNWKHSILDNPNSGYPIAYKVKNLKEIM